MRWSLLFALSVSASACASRPAVDAPGLGLRRVIVFRNGVGYFERAGTVRGDQVQFQVKARSVGDFLATFAVMERGGSRVRSASFPIEVQRAGSPGSPQDEAAPPGVEARPGALPPSPPRRPDPERLETVVMSLDGESHDLEVGYIAETPIWRPSYRLVVDEKGARLQSWAIVQNLSGEDWRGVRLSLVADAPLSFEAALGKPLVPARPAVNDAGEVIAVVPHTETSLADADGAGAGMLPAPPAPAANAPAMADMAAPEASEERALRSKARPREELRGAKPTLGRVVGGAVGGVPRANVAPSAPNGLSALAALALQGGSTRFDLAEPVTVPNESATMVLLFDREVPGETTFLYAPDPAIPASRGQPFRVARLVNKTGGALERGAIAIFSDGAFVGQGMLDGLPDGATATVPFALERSLGVAESREHDRENATLHRIEGGQLVVRRDDATRTRYRIRNGGDRRVKVRVKHGRLAGATLHAPPPGTEDNVGTGSALVPVVVEARREAELVVDERLKANEVLDWLSPLADEAVTRYLASPGAEERVATQLRTAWQVRQALLKGQDEIRTLTEEQETLQSSTDESRANLKALEKNRTAGDLRRRLVERLARDSSRLDEVTRRLVEVRVSAKERQIRFEEAVREIQLLPRG